VFEIRAATPFLIIATALAIKTKVGWAVWKSRAQDAATEKETDGCLHHILQVSESAVLHV